MSYLPELRASLVQAAAREAAAPRRRWGFGWLAPVAAAGVALAVVAVGIVLIGHRHPGGGASPAHPNGAATPQMPNPSGAEWNLIVKARRETVAHDSACSPFVSSRPAFRTGEPSRTLTAILGVLRQPASAADAVPLQLFQHGPPDIYRSAIRLAREQDGVAVYLVPTANVLGWKPVPRRCAAEEAAALDRDMQRAPAKHKAAALEGQRRYLAWQEYEAEHPQGVCLAEVHYDGARARQLAGAGIGCGWGVAEIELGLAGLGQTGSPGPSFFHGIVPDGVASVVLELPGHRGTVTAKVVDNVYLAPVPRSVDAPTRVLWLAADGGVIRTTRVP
ncbi:MAG: hypothetical protein ACTHMY_18500 [Solirubrobacteraceae bacterium]